MSQVNSNTSQLKPPQNTKQVTLLEYSQHFILQQNMFDDYGQTYLQIDKNSGNIQEIYKDVIDKDNKQNFLKQQQNSCFLGILKIYNYRFILFAQDIQQICKIGSDIIYKVCTISFQQFVENIEPKYKDDINDQQKSLQKLFSSNGFYFSFTKDLTQSKQFAYNSIQSNQMFLWSSYLLNNLEFMNISARWRVPLINGFVQVFQTEIGNKQLNYYLISRTSRFCAGTRFNSRGINYDGQVANFVETEAIMYFDRFVSSVVIVRGSCPVFWSQKGQHDQIKLPVSSEITHASFLSHFAQLNKDYGRVFCINLLQESKNNESKLINAFELHLQISKLPDVRYEYFDFHKICRDHQYNKINPLIKQKIGKICDIFGFFSQEVDTKKVLVQQNGVFRLNCFDCLDRNNIVMSKIVMQMFQNFMFRLGIDLTNSEHFGEDGIDQLDRPSNQVHKFVKQFKQIWADQGDAISNIYSGTDSKTSEFTKNEKSIFNYLDDGWKSIQRYYNATSADHVKQQSIDILLGNNNTITDVHEQQIQEKLDQRVAEYSNFSDLSLYIVTWNINGKDPQKIKTQQFKEIFQFENNKNPDIVIFGVQEMVALNAKNVVISNDFSKILKNWEDLIKNTLMEFDNYIIIKQQNLVGVMVIIFIKKSIKSRIHFIHSDDVKTGLIGGKLGNKGSCRIVLQIDDSQFIFYCCHLESGQKGVDQRLKQLQDIHETQFESRIKANHADYKFFFGDLNFRIDLKYPEALSYIVQNQEKTSLGYLKEANNYLQQLLQRDQLINCFQKEEYDILRQYSEMEIKFLPTYKFDVGTQQYDTSKKQRTPSWTDRILSWARRPEHLNQWFYRSIPQFTISDHKPVVCYMTLKVKSIDKKLLEKVHKEIIYENLNLDTEGIFGEIQQDDNFEADNLAKTFFFEK